MASILYGGTPADVAIAELGPAARAAATAAVADARLAASAGQLDGAVAGARSRPAAVPLSETRRLPSRRRGGSVPSTSAGWRGDYFNNTALQGAPDLSRAGVEIAFAWGGSPGPGIKPNGFSVRWTATQNLDGGWYDISGTHDDGLRMYVDGVIVLDAWWDGPPTAYAAAIPIAAGAHALVVEYYDRDGPAFVSLKLARRADVSPIATRPTSTGTPTPTPTAAPTNTPLPATPTLSTSTPAPGPGLATPPPERPSTPASGPTTGPTTGPTFGPTFGPTLSPTVAPPVATATWTTVPPTATSTLVPPPTATAAPSSINSVDRIIATRGNNLLHHEINLPSMIAYWSWGQHGTEDHPSLPPGAGSVNAWLVVERDDSQLNTELNVRVNVRNMRAYVFRPSTRTWTLAYSGLPTWMVRTADPGTAGPYFDVMPRVEADGSYSFDMPLGAALHMSSPAPGLRISESAGVLTTVEARVIGPDAAIAKLGMEAGADYRDASGSGGSIEQAGAGQFGLLTTYWRAFNMLSSTLSDADVRANPPPIR